MTRRDKLEFVTVGRLIEKMERCQTDLALLLANHWNVAQDLKESNRQAIRDTIDSLVNAIDKLKEKHCWDVQDD